MTVMCPEPRHGSQMIGEWEDYSNRAGSTTESGCCESQFPMNSHNMYATSREGECSAGTHFKCAAVDERHKRQPKHEAQKLAYCDPWPGIWGFVNTGRGAREAGRGNSSRMCTVTAVWISSLWKAQPKRGQQGAEQFWQQRQLRNYSALSKSLSSLSTQTKRESNTHHTAYLRPQLTYNIYIKT